AGAVAHRRASRPWPPPVPALRSRGDGAECRPSVPRVRLARLRLAVTLRARESALWCVGTGSYGSHSPHPRSFCFREKRTREDNLMTFASAHRLDGLEPDNLLAFLALLGLLRALEADDRGRPADDKLHPRVSWDIDRPPLRPRLVVARELATDRVLQRMAAGL